MIKRKQIVKGRVGSNRGFTMIELVAVLVILGIISAVAAVRLSSTSEYDLASQMEVVKSHLRLAQSRAMTSGTPGGINFDSTTTYYLFTGIGSTTPVLLPGEENTTVSLTTKKSGLTITSATQRITFNAYGSPCEPTGTPPVLVPLTANATVTTSGGSIIISKNTGFIQ